MEDPLDQIDDQYENLPANQDLNFGWKVLAFLIPISGAIMYFVHKDKNERKSQSACYAALWGMGFGLLLRFLGTVMGG